MLPSIQLKGNTLGNHRQNQELSEERYIEFVKKLKEGGPHDRRYIRMEKERWKDDFCRRHGVRPKFEKMDFFVSNVEFTHDEPSSSWRIRDVNHKSFSMRVSQ